MTTQTTTRDSTDLPDELVAPRHRRPFGVSRTTLIQAAVFVVVLALVLAPLAPTVYQSLVDQPLYAVQRAFTWDNYVRLFTEAGFGRVVVNSLVLAALTTVISVSLSAALAILLVRTRVPAGRIMNALLLWPIYISPLVLALGWIIVYGPAGFVSLLVEKVTGEVPWNLYSIKGMAVAEAVTMVPIGYLFCSGALRLADSSLEEAARTCGCGPLRVLWSVVLPMLRPPMFYSSLLIFSASLEELSVPLLYGKPVGIELFSTFVYDRGFTQSNPDYGLMGAACVLVLAVLFVLVSIQAFALRNTARFVSVRGKASRVRPLELGRLRWVGCAFAATYILLGPVIPLAGLVARAFTTVLSPLVSPTEVLTMSNFSTVLTYPSYVASIKNSLEIASIGAVVTTLLAAVVVLVARRSSFRFARPLEFTALTPQAIPGIILGLGFFWAFSWWTPISWVRGTMWALVIAFGVRALPAAFGAIAPVVMQVSKELDSSARTVGADWWTTFSRVLLRLIAPGLLASFILLFVQMVKEFSPAIFLASADNQVMGTTMLSMWTNGSTGLMAALSCIQIVIIAVFVLIAERLLRVRAYA